MQFFSVFFFFPLSLLLIYMGFEDEGSAGADDVHFGRLIKDKGGLGARDKWCLFSKMGTPIAFYFRAGDSVGIRVNESLKWHLDSSRIAYCVFSLLLRFLLCVLRSHSPWPCLWLRATSSHLIHLARNQHSCHHHGCP